jgi:hypothetical protein
MPENAVVEETLAVDDIVTVICPDIDFTDKQGVIVEIKEDGNPEGPIGVRFPSYYEYLFNYPNSPDTVVRFLPSDLQKNTRDDGQNISDEQLCNVLFGKDMWHSINHLPTPLMIGFQACTHKDCEQVVVARAMINCHGSVYEVDVCRIHSSWHGSNCDSFPCE